jgi:hypothetical protein
MNPMQIESQGKTWNRVLNMVRYGCDLGTVQIDGVSPVRWKAMVKQVARFLNNQW